MIAGAAADVLKMRGAAGLAVDDDGAVDVGEGDVVPGGGEADGAR